MGQITGIMDTTVHEKKQQMRRTIKALLRGLSLEDRERRSEDVCRKIKSLPLYQKAKTIVFYYPLDKEVNVISLIVQALGEQKVVGLPRVLSDRKTLKMCRIESLSSLEAGPWGIRQPRENGLQEIETHNIDALLVPGIAFDRQGNRLGRGGGFYDSFLCATKDTAVKIGVCFSFQIQDNLPREPLRDAKVNFVVSA